jgi:cytochrome c556
MLAACHPKADAPEATAGAAQSAVPTVHESMTQTFTPQSNRLWELAGNLYGDNGGLDASLLSDAQWQELGTAAQRMRDVASALAEATAVRAAAEGVQIQAEGTPGSPGAAQVQALIDADLNGFREEARKLVAVAGDAAAAAQAHDAAKLDDASNNLNEVCTSCHTRFWYAQQ